MNKSKFLKKSLAMLLAMLMVVAMIPLSAAADDVAPEEPTPAPSVAAPDVTVNNRNTVKPEQAGDPYTVTVQDATSVSMSWVPSKDADGNPYKAQIVTARNITIGVPFNMLDLLQEGKVIEENEENNSVTYQVAFQLVATAGEDKDKVVAEWPLNITVVNTIPNDDTTIKTVVANQSFRDGSLNFAFLGVKGVVNNAEETITVTLPIGMDPADAGFGGRYTTSYPNFGQADTVAYDNNNDALKNAVGQDIPTRVVTNGSSLSGDDNDKYARRVFVPTSTYSTVNYTAPATKDGSGTLTVTARDGRTRNYTVVFEQEEVFENVGVSFGADGTYYNVQKIVNEKTNGVEVEYIVSVPAKLLVSGKKPNLVFKTLGNVVRVEDPMDAPTYKTTDGDDNVPLQSGKNTQELGVAFINAGGTTSWVKSFTVKTEGNMTPNKTGDVNHDYWKNVKITLRPQTGSEAGEPKLVEFQLNGYDSLWNDGAELPASFDYWVDYDFEFSTGDGQHPARISALINDGGSVSIPAQDRDLVANSYWAVDKTTADGKRMMKPNTYSENPVAGSNGVRWHYIDNLNTEGGTFVVRVWAGDKYKDYTITLRKPSQNTGTAVSAVKLKKWNSDTSKYDILEATKSADGRVWTFEVPTSGSVFAGLLGGTVGEDVYYATGAGALGTSAFVLPGRTPTGDGSEADPIDYVTGGTAFANTSAITRSLGANATPAAVQLNLVANKANVEAVVNATANNAALANIAGSTTDPFNVRIDVVNKKDLTATAIIPLKAAVGGNAEIVLGYATLDDYTAGTTGLEFKSVKGGTGNTVVTLTVVPSQYTGALTAAMVDGKSFAVGTYAATEDDADSVVLTPATTPTGVTPGGPAIDPVNVPNTSAIKITFTDSAKVKALLDNKWGSLNIAPTLGNVSFEMYKETSTDVVHLIAKLAGQPDIDLGQFTIDPGANADTPVNITHPTTEAGVTAGDTIGTIVGDNVTATTAWTGIAPFSNGADTPAKEAAVRAYFGTVYNPTKFDAKAADKGTYVPKANVAYDSDDDTVADTWLYKYADPDATGSTKSVIPTVADDCLVIVDTPAGAVVTPGGSYNGKTSPVVGVSTWGVGNGFNEQYTPAAVQNNDGLVAYSEASNLYEELEEGVTTLWDWWNATSEVNGRDNTFKHLVNMTSNAAATNDYEKDGMIFQVKNGRNGTQQPYVIRFKKKATASAPGGAEIDAVAATTAIDEDLVYGANTVTNSVTMMNSNIVRNLVVAMTTAMNAVNTAFVPTNSSSMATTGTGAAAGTLNTYYNPGFIDPNNAAYVGAVGGHNEFLKADEKITVAKVPGTAKEYVITVHVPADFMSSNQYIAKNGAVAGTDPTGVTWATGAIFFNTLTASSGATVYRNSGIVKDNAGTNVVESAGATNGIIDTGRINANVPTIPYTANTWVSATPNSWDGNLANFTLNGADATQQAEVYGAANTDAIKRFEISNTDLDAWKGGVFNSDKVSQSNILYVYSKDNTKAKPSGVNAATQTDKDNADAIYYVTVVRDADKTGDKLTAVSSASENVTASVNQALKTVTLNVPASYNWIGTRDSDKYDFELNFTTDAGSILIDAISDDAFGFRRLDSTGNIYQNFSLTDLVQQEQDINKWVSAADEPTNATQFFVKDNELFIFNPNTGAAQQITGMGDEIKDAYINSQWRLIMDQEAELRVYTEGRNNLNTYKLILNILPESSIANLTHVQVDESTAEIDNDARTAVVSLPDGTDYKQVRISVGVNGLSTVVSVDGEPYDPNNNTTYDITDPIQIVIAAENGTQYTYTLTAGELPSPSPSPSAEPSDEPSPTPSTEPTLPSDMDKVTPSLREDVIKALTNGLMQGGPDGLFYPTNPMKRYEFALVVARASLREEGETGTAADLDKILIEQYGDKTTKFADVNDSNWGGTKSDAAVAAINMVIEKNLMLGVSDTAFAPTGSITREQAALIMARVAGLDMTDTDVSNFADASKISSWAKGGVAAAVKAGIMNGTGNDNFTPLRVLQRQEGAAILARYYVDGNGKPEPEEPENPDEGDEGDEPSTPDEGDEGDEPSTPDEGDEGNEPSTPDEGGEDTPSTPDEGDDDTSSTPEGGDEGDSSAAE